jgi:hypothetical protein
MKRLALLLFVVPAGCSLFHGTTRVGGFYNNAVHRFFPDLDRRQNAIRYGRWRALEVAWRNGISPALDRDFAETLRLQMQKLPDFPPDARLSAPRFAREAAPAFEALGAADELEKEVEDALAAGNASPVRDAERIEAALRRYNRQPRALSEPSATLTSPARMSDLSSARLLLTGDWLFAQSAEDLAASDYGEQRWKVHATVERYDHEIVLPAPSVRTEWYRKYAPTFTSRHPRAAEVLDRVTRFRVEIFAALLSGVPDERARGVERVEARFGLAR